MNFPLFVPLIIIGMILVVVIRFIRRTEQEDQKLDIYHKIQPFAKNTKIILQMIIGFGLTYLIILNLLFILRVGSGDVLEKQIFSQEVSGNATPSQVVQVVLGMVGLALAFSSAIELAYTLYTPGPDEAIDPLIIGLAAAFLLTISNTKSPNPTDAGTDVLLLVALAGLFAMKKIFIVEESSNNIQKGLPSTIITINLQKAQMRQAYLKLVEKGTPEQVKALIETTAQWLNAHPRDIEVHKFYLELVEKGTPEQIAVAINTTNSWLAVNPRDTEIHQAYLKLVKQKGTPEQIAVAINTTNSWLTNNLQKAQVRQAYLELAEKGTPEQVKALIETTARWLNAHPRDIEVHKFYLELVEKGTPEQIAAAINALWLVSNVKKDNQIRFQRRLQKIRDIWNKPKEK